MSEPKFEEPSSKPAEEHPKKSESFLDKPVTRRDVLKVGAAVGAAYTFKDWKDFRKEELAQYEVPPKLKEVFELMQSLNLELPKDTLYGFTFPTTKEMAEKFKEALERQIGDLPTPALIVVQERDPKTIIGSIVYFNRGVTPPRVGRSHSPDSPSFLYLPDYSEKDSAPKALPYIYHEGYHLFYQTGIGDSDQDSFNDENIANIANVLLRKLMESLKYHLNNSGSGAVKAYENAVAQNDKTIWEKYLKELYKLPENCCTFNPQTNS